MIPTSRVLDSVVDILKESGRPLVAREIAEELNRKGILINKMALNAILWKKTRSELTVNERTWEWKYEPSIATKLQESETRIEDNKQLLGNIAATTKLLTGIGFDFFGVTRKGSSRPFFFVKENQGYNLLVGPSGNILREKTDLCSAPEIRNPEDFTEVQIKSAAEEYFNEYRREIAEGGRRMIKLLRETEQFANDVYDGPPSERVNEAIPVTGLIYVTHLIVATPSIVELGVGAVFEPIFLVVELLGGGIEDDSRYGVFKLCLYELLKKDLIAETGGDLQMTLHYNLESVVIRNGDKFLHLR